MAQWWSDFLDEVRAGGVVVPIDPSAAGAVAG